MKDIWLHRYCVEDERSRLWTRWRREYRPLAWAASCALSFQGYFLFSKARQILYFSIANVILKKKCFDDRIQVYMVYYIIACQIIPVLFFFTDSCHYICNDAWSLTRKKNNKIALAIANAFVFVPIGPLPPSSGPFYYSIQWPTRGWL